VEEFIFFLVTNTLVVFGLFLMTREESMDRIKILLGAFKEKSKMN